MRKFARLIEVIREEGLTPEAWISEPEPARPEWLSMVHECSYVNGVLAARLPHAIERQIGLPIDAGVARRSRAACGGTLLTARLALRHGLACNTAGGSHHAGPEHGAGYCVFNDVAMAIAVLMAEGVVHRPLVIDLDVHQGDGTARIFADAADVFTFSMHGEKNYPVRKATSDLDVALPDGMGDRPYLELLKTYLPGLIAAHGPDIVFYNAGVDPWEGDRLGRLALTYDGLAERDRTVIAMCLERAIPVACVIGGGYSADIDEVAWRHAILHRTAAALASQLPV